MVINPSREPLFVTLLTTAHALQERLESALKPIGLSRAKMEVLSQLAAAGEPLPLRMLAEGNSCVPSNMTTLVDRLESEGLVRRVHDPSDRRSVRAELTDLGADRAAAGSAAVARVQDEFNAILTAPERSTLDQLLTTIRAG